MESVYYCSNKLDSNLYRKMYQTKMCSNWRG